MPYEWDDLKRQANIAKHGVDFSLSKDFDWDQATDTEDDRRDYGGNTPGSPWVYWCSLACSDLYETGGHIPGHQPSESECPREEFL